MLTFVNDRCAEGADGGDCRRFAGRRAGSDGRLTLKAGIESVRGRMAVLGRELLFAARYPSVKMIRATSFDTSGSPSISCQIDNGHKP